MSDFIPPIPSLLYHCDHMSSSSNTEQPRFHIVPIRMDESKITMHEDKEHYADSMGEPELPDWAQATTHISPHSALAALAAHPTDISAPQEVINGLINTIRFQRQEANNKISLLRTAMEAQEALVQDLTDRLAKAKGAINLDQPEGFENNNSHIHSLIPIGGGLKAVPKWIQKRDNGKVGLWAGKEEEEPTYVTKLYVDPNYLGDCPVHAMAPWLKHMLTSSTGENHCIRATLLDLNKWGLQADAKRYKRYTDALVHVHNKMQLLEGEEAFYQEEVLVITYHMEAARAMDKLGHLQAAEEGEQVGRRSADGKRFKHGQGCPL